MKPTKLGSLTPADRLRYFAEIGRKGGEANKGKEATREKCRRAALIRWGRLKKGATDHEDEEGKHLARA